MSANFIKEVEIAVIPAEIDNEEVIKAKLAKAFKNPIRTYVLLRSSIDARGKRPLYRLRYGINGSLPPTLKLSDFEDVSTAPVVLIIGAGPAGYLAALQCIRLKLRPVILERGKSVRERRRDLRAIQQFGTVNPDSNYCFGEGGAGTYSDGKLYTRSQKRGNIQEVLEILVAHGASEAILTDAHPHIGSNKLPTIVANIRETIEKCGGQIHFDARVTDFIIRQQKFCGVVVNEKQEYLANATILATGHSARDVFELCYKHQIAIQSKPFALGVRIEHPQEIIDAAQYKQPKREENLPAASYALTCQIKQRGVYSFCMCPGGLIVPASTAPGELVVNGMSLSRRDSPYANSGTVVEITEEDVQQFSTHQVFAGLHYQQAVERKVFAAGDGTQKAPAQRLTDFAAGKLSSTLDDSSYIPGLISAPVHELLPKNLAQRLQEAIRVFGKKMPGYFTEHANVVATESRTSSPIQIPRDKQTCLSISHEGLFPCGEGAGYAGGILSAAMDGQRVATSIKLYYETVKTQK